MNLLVRGLLYIPVPLYLSIELDYGSKPAYSAIQCNDHPAEGISTVGDITTEIRQAGWSSTERSSTVHQGKAPPQF